MNIMVTGANGFLGSNIINLLKRYENIKIFEVTRKTIDLLNIDQTKIYIEDNKITHIIHTAIEGGRRIKIDTADVFYNNVLVFENLALLSDYYTNLITFGSGAEKKYTFVNEELLSEKEIEYKLKSPPISYYGLSKYIIHNRAIQFPNIINLRIFNCFYHNETKERMIRSGIEAVKNDRPIIIHQDKYMDFFYFEDLFEIVKKYIWWNDKNLPKNIDCCYSLKYKLTDIANIINSLSNKKVEILIENPIKGPTYVGDSTELEKLNLPLKGLIQGIKECYNNL